MAVLGPWADGLTDEQIEVRRARARAWKAANKLRHQANSAAYKRRHRARLAARIAVTSAIAAGRLTRLPCELCGDPQTHGHHDDYAETLSVRWLCRAHHAEADVLRRQRARTEGT